MSVGSRNLPIVVLPQMHGGVITVGEIEVGGGVYVRIPPYQSAARGDVIRIYWDTLLVKEWMIVDPSSELPLVWVVTDEIGLGEHEVYCSLDDAAGNQGDSDLVYVEIIAEEVESEYDAPVFTDAVGGVLTGESLIENEGTHIRFQPYDGMALGDVVTLFWKGDDPQGVNLVSFTSGAVVQQDNLTGGIGYLVPLVNFDYLTRGCTCRAYCQVVMIGGRGVSSTAIVEIGAETVIPERLDMIVSSGAPSTDYEAINVYPFNQGVVMGTPGLRVYLKLDGEYSTFDENDAGVYTAVLDGQGVADFKIKSTRVGGVNVVAYYAGNILSRISRYIEFEEYYYAGGAVSYVASTTGAPANGETPCTCYIRLALGEASAYVYVEVSGSALIKGANSNKAYIPVSLDKSVAIDVVCSAPESVTVKLMVPESYDPVYRYMVFV